MDCLLSSKVYENPQIQIRSKNHKIGLYKTMKSSLSPIDTKRYIRQDGISTYAFGHYRILLGEQAVQEPQAFENINELLDLIESDLVANS